MAKDKQAQTAKGKAGGGKLARRQRAIGAGLEKLGKKFEKIHDRQKRLRRQGRDRKHENLAFARELRKLQRKTNGLLDQLSGLKADGRRMEQRMAADLLSAGEVSASLASYDSRLAITDLRLEKLQGRGRELERLGLQMSGRADALERHIRVMQEELRSYTQAASEALTLPVESEQARDAEAPEVVNGSANGEGRPSGNGQGSNVLAFRKAEQGEAGIDERLLEDLDKRISGLERLAGGLDERIQGFGLAMRDLEDGQRQLRGEQESIRQWLEHQGEELFAGQDALRAQTARLDSDLQELSQIRSADREILTRLDRDSGDWAERIDRLERQLAASDSRAQDLAGQVEGLESTAHALRSDAEQRLDESRSLLDRTANLDRGVEQVRAVGSELQKRIGALDAADGRLKKGHRELAEWTGAMSAESAAMAGRQRRLGLGLGLLGLLLLGLAIAGYWLFDSRFERQTRTFAQDLAELQQGLEAGEDRLDVQAAELKRVAQAGEASAGSVNGIDKVDGLFGSEYHLLIAQRQDLGMVQGELEELRAEQGRLLARAERMEEALKEFDARQGSLSSGVIAPAPSAPAPDGVLGPDWIAAQDPAGYTIQIVAAHDPKVIARTVQAQAYSVDLAQYRRLRNGRDWYVLVHGSYPDLKAALAALGRLPAAVQKHGPWIRSFGSVQRQLARR